MERTIRAKMQVQKVELHQGGNETVHLVAVAKSGGYPADGHDEDNSFARWSPSGSMSLTIANPDLHGKIKPGDKFYLDFTRAE